MSTLSTLVDGHMATRARRRGGSLSEVYTTGNGRIAMTPPPPPPPSLYSNQSVYLYEKVKEQKADCDLCRCVL